MATLADANRPLFPLIRHFSGALTSVLVRTPATPNQVTLAGAAAGLAGVWCYSLGTQASELGGALLIVLYYALDNADGEIARIKGQTSRYGALLDSVVDAVVHTVFFLGLGVGVWRATGESMWMWMGAVAAFGSFVNAALSFPAEIREVMSRDREPDSAEEFFSPRGTLKEHVFYAARTLSRADFCFILLALSVFHAGWLLLPAGAIGCQVYWISGLSKKADIYRV